MRSIGSFLAVTAAVPSEEVRVTAAGAGMTLSRGNEDHAAARGDSMRKR